MSSENVFVYVQALPVSGQGSPRSFGDLEHFSFELSNSSKTALAFATKIGKPIAVGYHLVLREALARGAVDSVSVPLCDDPVVQAESFPEISKSLVLIGDNYDGIFTGASLAGALAERFGIPFRIERPGSVTGRLSKPSIVLLKDDGMLHSYVDARNINGAFDRDINPKTVNGESFLSKVKVADLEVKRGSAEEVSSIIARRIRRYGVWKI